MRNELAASILALALLLSGEVGAAAQQNIAGAAVLNSTAFADPSAAVGPPATNGSATTAMRSDAAPMLSQSSSYTWTGAHTFGKVVGGVTADSTTSRTLGAADCGTTVQFTNAGAIAVTVPNSLPVGCNIALEQDGAGQITVSAGSGATARSPHSYTKTFAQYSIIGISVISNSGGAAAVYNFVGDGA